MKLPQWLAASDAEDFGRELGAEFFLHFPVEKPMEEREARRRLANAIDILGNRVVKFHRERHLGWYRKARFMKVIRGHLLERGLPEEQVDALVYALVLRLARA